MLAHCDASHEKCLIATSVPSSYAKHPKRMVSFMMEYVCKFDHCQFLIPCVSKDRVDFMGRPVRREVVVYFFVYQQLYETRLKCSAQGIPGMPASSFVFLSTRERKAGPDGTDAIYSLKNVLSCKGIRIKD